MPSDGDVLSQARNCVWGSALENANGTGPLSSASSTLIWGWSPLYAGTASGPLDQRYYLNTGRFLTPDPYRASGGAADPQGWNRYACVQNNPVNWRDPTGRMMCYTCGLDGGGGDPTPAPARCHGLETNMESLKSVRVYVTARPQTTFWFRAALFCVVLIGMFAEPGLAESSTLCPNLIASLPTSPGNLDATYAAQRLEIRQCPVDIAKRLGVFQLVAWSKNATSPTLVYEVEESAFHQFVMIEGVYVFEFVGGTAQLLVAIVFEGGGPRIGLNVSTLAEPKIISTPSMVLIEYIDNRDHKLHRQEFSKSGKTQRNG